MVTNGIVNHEGRAYFAPSYEVEFQEDSRWEARTSHKGVPEPLRTITGTIKKGDDGFWAECDVARCGVLHHGGGHNKKVAITDAILSYVLSGTETVELKPVS